MRIGFELEPKHPFELPPKKKRIILNFSFSIRPIFLNGRAKLVQKCHEVVRLLWNFAYSHSGNFFNRGKTSKFIIFFYDGVYFKTIVLKIDKLVVILVYYFGIYINIKSVKKRI